MNKTYERHTNDKYANINLPIIFHYDRVQGRTFYHIHWHENIEILFFDEGTCEVLVDEHIYTVNKNEIAVINSGEIHATRAVMGETCYYCLIINKKLCEQFGFFIDEQQICNVIKNDFLFKKLDEIKKELSTKSEFYIPSVMSAVLEILTVLYRNHQFTKTRYEKNKNIEMVKSGISFIKKHLDEQLSIDDIANHTGYSKYYFCRCFKDVTGYTVNTYINREKVENAKEMLANKQFSVSEVSEMCGFSDISYFTKIFKKYTGILPSKVKAEKQRG